MFKPTPTSHIGAAFVVGAEALAIGHQRRAQAIAQVRRAAGLPQPLEAGNRVTAHRPRVGTFAPARFATKSWLAIPALALVAAMLGMATRAHADCTDGERTLSEKEKQPVVAMSEAIREGLPRTPAGWLLSKLGASANEAGPKPAKPRLAHRRACRA